MTVITNHVGENGTIGIIPIFLSLPVILGLRQYLSIGSQNGSTDHPVRKIVLSGIIRAVNKRLPFCPVKISKITGQADENRRKKVGYEFIFFVSGARSFASQLFFPFLLLLPFFLQLFLLLLVDVSQFLRPHLLSIYTIPG